MINTENKQKDKLITEGSALLAEWVDWYLSLSVHERINFKQSFFDIE